MKGTISRMKIGGYACSLYLPQNYLSAELRYPVIYMNGGDNIEEIVNAVETEANAISPFIFLAVSPADWNREFTPWPAPALKADVEPFGGCAGDYLRVLTERIKPYIDANYKTMPEPKNTALIGYSLGGLIALYALYTCGVFGKIGSLSGSLWYDDWLLYMKDHRPQAAHAKVYLSLGKSEPRIKNARMAKVGECTQAAVAILHEKLSAPDDVILEWNAGGHFSDIPDRFKKAITAMMKI